MQKRDDETMTQFTVRKMNFEVAEKCAQIAREKGRFLDEPAVGDAIAKSILAAFRE